MSVECDSVVYDRPGLDPYVEKFGDYEPTKCQCEDCCRFRSKYDLKGKHMNEEEVYETVPERVQEA